MNYLRTEFHLPVVIRHNLDFKNKYFSNLFFLPSTMRRSSHAHMCVSDYQIN